MAQEQGQEQARWDEQVVARAWADEAFKQRLLAEPHAVLKEHGISLREDVTVRVLENTAQVVHLVLPACPSTDVSGFGAEMPGQPGVSGPVPAPSPSDHAGMARLVVDGTPIGGIGFEVADMYKPKPR
jgi:hypothetical protein